MTMREISKSPPVEQIPVKLPPKDETERPKIKRRVKQEDSKDRINISEEARRRQKGSEK